jgi:hypothetical protein
MIPVRCGKAKQIRCRFKLGCGQSQSDLGTRSNPSMAQHALEATHWVASAVRFRKQLVSEGASANPALCLSSTDRRGGHHPLASLRLADPRLCLLMVSQTKSSYAI